MDGLLVDDPLSAAGSQPEVDLDGLALLFTGPGLSGEFPPSSYFCGVDLVWPPVVPVRAAQPLRQVFAAAVAELCADAAVVGVALSGGLDSFAVLVHVLALRPRRRVVGFVVDLVADDGDSAVAVARRLLADLRFIDVVQLVEIEPADRTTSVRWSPYGPRAEALPTATAAIAKLAAGAGVDVLLTGDGADELLAMPRYATMAVVRSSGARAGARYVSDMAQSGPGIAGELLAIASHALPGVTRGRLYWAANWPDWSPPAVSPVLGDTYRGQARTWTRQWADDTMQAHRAAGRPWAAADAFDAWWPRNYRPPAGAISEVSPFLHPDVVAAALALPVASRYAGNYRLPYLRAKAQVVQLFSPGLRPLLPRYKRMYRTALSAAASSAGDAPFACSIGLLDPQAIAREPDVATCLMVDAVEQWLTGAATAGVTVQGAGSAGRSRGDRPR